MAEKAPPGRPTDLVTVPTAAREVGKSYRVTLYHVKKAGLAKWETGAGIPLVSLEEIRAYFAARDTIRPREEGDD